MTTDYRVELQRLVKAYDDHGGNWPEDDVEALRQAVERARILLSQPEPEGLTDEEIDALERRHWQLTGVVNESLQQEELFDYRAFLREGLARWGRPVTTQEAS